MTIETRMRPKINQRKGTTMHIALALFAISFLGCGHAGFGGARKGVAVTLPMSFENAEDEKGVFGEAGFERVSQHATDGKYAAKVDLNKPEAGFGLRSEGPTMDFSKGDKIKFDIFREGDPCTINFRVRDKNQKSYSAWYYLIRPGKNVVEFSVHGMAGSVDVSAVREFWFYSEQQSGVVFVDNIRLTSGVDDDSWQIPETPARKHVEVPGNMFANGGFEIGMHLWNSWGSWDDGQYWFSSATGAEARSGAAAMAIISKKVGRGGIFSEPINMRPGTYELRYFAKAKGNDVQMFWGFDGDDKHSLDQISCDRFAVKEDWQQHHRTIRVSRDARSMRLYFFSTGGGTLLLDDISLVPADGGETSNQDWGRNLKPTKFEIKGKNVFANDQPFFPIGFFGGEPESLEGTGFNFIVSGIPEKDFLDRCHQRGIYVSANLQGVMRAHLPWQAPKAIESLKRHPAIAAWYVCDEPDHSQWTVPPPEMRLASSLLKKNDPNHPTWTVVMPWADSNLYQYADTVEILGSDVYPIEDEKRHPLTMVAEKTDVLRRAVKDKRPVWLVTQSHRNLKPADVYALTYLGVTHGANAIIYWNYFDVREDAKMWKTMVQISLELKQLTPALLADVGERRVLCANDSIHATVRQVKDRIYVIAVNGTNANASGVDLTVQDLKYSRSAKVLFEDRNVTARSGTISDSFGPYERHVYELGPLN